MTRIRLLPLVAASMLLGATFAGSSPARANDYLGNPHALPVARYSFFYGYGPHSYQYRYSAPMGGYQRFRHGGYPRWQRGFRNQGFYYQRFKRGPRFRGPRFGNFYSGGNRFFKRPRQRGHRGGRGFHRH